MISILATVLGLVLGAGVLSIPMAIISSLYYYFFDNPQPKEQSAPQPRRPMM